jgi:hypothetical protein
MRVGTIDAKKQAKDFTNQRVKFIGYWKDKLKEVD